MVPVHGMPRHPYPTGHKVMCLNAPGVALELREEASVINTYADSAA